MKTTQRFCLFTAAATATLFAVLPAYAEIEEIIVSAQRRQEQLQKVPIAVTAFTANTMAKAGIKGSDDINQLTPGLLISRQIGNVMPYIRGVGTANSSPAEEPATAFYEDGFYLTHMGSMEMQFNNVERIEVLKGPQGTLFGRNATGGLIQIITKDPSFEPQLKIGAGYGNYGTYSANLYASAGITKKLAVDVAVSGLHQDKGFGHNLVDGSNVDLSKVFGLRTKWLFKPSEWFDTTTAFIYNKSNTGYGAMIRQGTFARYPVTVTPAGAFVTPNGIRYNPGGNTVLGHTGGFQDTYSDFLFRSVNEDWALRNTTRLNLDAFTVKLLTQYREAQNPQPLDQDRSPFTLSSSYQVQYGNVWTEELQFLSNSEGRITWTGGVFFMDSRGGYLVRRTVNITSATPETRQAATIRTASIAGYLQGSLAITKMTKFTLGGRYTSDERKITGGTWLPSGAPAPGAAIVPLASAKWSRPTWRVSLDHQFTDNILGYVSYNRGFKSGVYNSVNVGNPAVNPEQIDAYEAGFKADLFGNRLRVNGAGYHYDYKDVQLQQVQIGTTLLLNAARGEINGGELEIQASPIDNLNIRGGVAVTDAKYTSFPGCPATIPNPVTTGGNTNATIDCTGNKFVRTPPYQFNLGADYTIPSPIGSFNVSADYAYWGKIFFNADNRAPQEAYGLLNASASWTSPNDRWTLRVWGKNLTDEEYIVTLTQTGGALSGDFYTPGAPLTYGVQIDWSFQ